MTPCRLALALVLALPFLAGCNPAAKVIGTWDMKLEEPEDPSGGAFGGTRLPPAMVNAMKPKMNVEFKANGNCVVETYLLGNKATGRGKWKHVKTDKDVTTLKVKMEGPADDEGKTEYEEKELQVRFIDHNKVEMIPLPVSEESWSEQTITFARRDF
jgi:hypothetical protein